MKDPPLYFMFDTRALQLPGMLRELDVVGCESGVFSCFRVVLWFSVPFVKRCGCRTDVHHRSPCALGAHFGLVDNTLRQAITL